MSESSTLLVGLDILEGRIDVAPAFTPLRGGRANGGMLAPSRVTWLSTASCLSELGSIHCGNTLVSVSPGLSNKRRRSRLRCAEPSFS